MFAPRAGAEVWPCNCVCRASPASCRQCSPLRQGPKAKQSASHHCLMLLSVSIQLALGACGRSDAQDQVSKVVSRLASLGSPSPHVGRGGSGVFVGRSWCAHITAGLGYLVCWEYTQSGTIPDSLKLQLVHNLLSKTDIFFFFFPLLRFRVLLNLCLFFFFFFLTCKLMWITLLCLLLEASAAVEWMPACLLMGTSVIFYLFCNPNLSETISVHIQSIQLRH